VFKIQSIDDITMQQGTLCMKALYTPYYKHIHPATKLLGLADVTDADGKETNWLDVGLAKLRNRECTGMINYDDHVHNVGKANCDIAKVGDLKHNIESHFITNTDSACVQAAFNLGITWLKENGKLKPKLAKVYPQTTCASSSSTSSSELTVEHFLGLFIINIVLTTIALVMRFLRHQFFASSDDSAVGTCIEQEESVSDSEELQRCSAELGRLMEEQRNLHARMEPLLQQKHTAKSDVELHQELHALEDSLGSRSGRACCSG
jgi:hypothetical protein